MDFKIKGSKRIAAYSLILMGVGFIATAPFQDILLIHFLHGGFEAGLVGGLADWFAVTALFRHPLGIPIPHTALLPNNRERLTEGLVAIVKNDWLSKESIKEKAKEFPFSKKISSLLTKEIQTDAFKQMLIKVVKNMINDLDVEKLTPVVKRLILYALSQVEITPFIQLVRTKLVQENLDTKAMDHLFQKIELWLKSEQTVKKLGKVSMNSVNKIESSGFQRFAFKSIKTLLSEDKLGQIVQNVFLQFFESIQKDGTPNRRLLVTYLRKELNDIENNEVLLDVIEKWRDQLIHIAQSDQVISEKLKLLQQNLLDMVDTKFIDTYAVPVIDGMLDNLAGKGPEVDGWIQAQLVDLVEENHSKIGELVKENLNKLDNKALIDLVENNIGKDLQWIRVNGAFCGFVIGLLLTGIKVVIG